MTAPEDPAWLSALVERSAVLPDASLREHWINVIGWLPADLRYELAGILMDVAVACRER